MTQFESFEKWLFPPQCVLSGQPTQDWDLADVYLQKLSRPSDANQKSCFVCAEPLAVDGICGRCLQTPPVFEQTQAGFYYTSVVQDLIHSFKYEQQLHLGRLLAQLWRPQLVMTGIDAILPVPLHRDRLLERGFNQALELANGLVGDDEVPILPFAIQRIKPTVAQALLNAQQRQHNLDGAFAVNPKAESVLSACQQVAILDDVMTTGSTLNQVALTLKTKFPHLKIQAWALARAKSH
ncbi:ComF family protein [Hydrogenovibrio sp. SC-1]|uniref:ComF family protein n=1 Tax=Hydrogenovibrio sp. SC-1 TaxID=2065820 RepID=UPI001179A8A4|nr:ComF family protein [Hydrogenovibrio sp. SC-1]